MKVFWKELKRRNVNKAAIAYLAVSWLIIQVLDIVLPNTGAPDWVMQVALIIIAIGFPIWIFIAWVYEITPNGVRKTSKTGTDESITAQTNKRLNILIVLALIGVVMITIFFSRAVMLKMEDGKYAIAVLYFDNMSADDDNAWIGDGMTESIITKLGNIKDLTVIGKTSVKQFKKSDASIPEIAKKLAVSYILEGSVIYQNGRAVITARLIDKNDKNVLKFNNYEVLLNNVLDVQNDIAGQIVNELKIVLSPSEKKELQHKITTNPDAYKLYRKGIEYADDRSEEGLRKSIEAFERAIELDSNFADAYAEMANSYFLLRNQNASFASLDKIEELNDKALSIDSNCVRVYSFRGLSEASKGNWDQAEKIFKKIIAISPNNAVAHQYYGLSLARKPIIDPDQVLAEDFKAQQLEPLHMIMNINLMEAYLYTFNEEKAQQLLEKRGFLFKKYKKEDFKAKIKGLRKKDYSIAISEMLKLIEKEPENDEWHYLISKYYRFINDNANWLKHAEINYELFTNSFMKGTFFDRNYFFSLLENGKFNLAHDIFLGNDERMKTLIPYDRKYLYAEYYYNKGEYQKALDSIEQMHNWLKPRMKVKILAKMGDMDQLNELLSSQQFSYQDKATVYAILGNRDSLYASLDKVISHMRALEINGYDEFNPYRNDKQFKAFQKRNYLPISSVNK